MEFNPKKLKAIYVPGGRAYEYAHLAVNLYNGCPHGCRYCYAPAALHVTRKQFYSRGLPRPGILDKIRSDAAYLAECGVQEEILLCFHCDPYHSDQPCFTETTKEALEILAAAKLRATVLTKGGMRAERDFPLLADAGFAFGTSLSWTNEKDRQKWEPAAEPIWNRMWAIRIAHDMGIRTWVSVEPVIDPEQAVELIHMLSDNVDLWKVGKLNHDKAREGEVDWAAFRVNVEAALKSVGAQYIIKRDLLEAI